MQKITLPLLAILLVMLLSACMPAAAAPQVGSSRAECPVTAPPEPAFVPPQPWPAELPNDGWFWYGGDGLWTMLPGSGNWRQLQLGEKFWWWSEKFDVTEDETPDLVLTGRRLDGEGEFSVDEATNGYEKSIHWAMLAGVQLPSEGCWEITGAYQGQELTLVVWVP